MLGALKIFTHLFIWKYGQHCDVRCCVHTCENGGMQAANQERGAEQGAT